MKRMKRVEAAMSKRAAGSGTLPFLQESQGVQALIIIKSKKITLLFVSFTLTLSHFPFFFPRGGHALVYSSLQCILSIIMFPPCHPVTLSSCHPVTLPSASYLCCNLAPPQQTPLLLIIMSDTYKKAIYKEQLISPPGSFIGDFEFPRTPWKVRKIGFAI